MRLEMWIDFVNQLTDEDLKRIGRREASILLDVREEGEFYVDGGGWNKNHHYPLVYARGLEGGSRAFKAEKVKKSLLNFDAPRWIKHKGWMEQENNTEISEWENELEMLGTHSSYEEYQNLLKRIPSSDCPSCASLVIFLVNMRQVSEWENELEMLGTNSASSDYVTMLLKAPPSAPSLEVLTQFVQQRMSV